MALSLTQLSIYGTIIYVLVRIIKKHRESAENNLRITTGTHVVISGGSKGIGKELAIKFSQMGAHVTILARNPGDLNSAKEDIERHRKNARVQQIRAVSMDVTKITFPNDINTEMTPKQRDTLDSILGEHERCDILVNCCGSSIPLRFEDLSQEQFRYMMDVNYFSAVNLIRLLLPTMKSRAISSSGTQKSNGSRIVFVSSMCGLLSFFGFSAYSASKFALVGLAEALEMELKPFDIGITVAFPPDTDTPGLKEENKIKPELTAMMSQSGNLYSAEQVAKTIINDIRSKRFCSTIGLDNKCVLMLMNSFMPVQSIGSLLMESLLACPLKIVAYFIRKSWTDMVDKEAQKEIQRSKAISGKRK